MINNIHELYKRPCYKVVSYERVLQCYDVKDVLNELRLYPDAIILVYNTNYRQDKITITRVTAEQFIREVCEF